ncbi:orotate phosphoribosyltransferase [Lentibacillus saliphilus]|uniref:orotate phosphoribosyltransferase n=1 Tax=Lentibacillus saliphilus TaxID=2737028 RepID=UPI001C306852|nr:orotate phosphoribosyltransferase [Lentibacillus saliphilus]
MEKHIEIAKELLNIQAVQINPEHYFTWTSGIKSPIYCDNRLIMAYPELRQKVVDAWIDQIRQMDIGPDVIAGCATAGIPHAAWLADKLNLPMVYVRSEAKKHGKGNQIEGLISEGQRVILIEDLISTGKSSINAAKALEHAGANVIGVQAIFSYGLQSAQDNFSKAPLTYQSITGFNALVDLLEKEGQIDTKQKEALMDWQRTL